MKKFLSNLQFVTIGAFVAAVFLFIVNVFAGRILGPDQYGRYLLIISVSNLMVIPMLLNFHSGIIKYLSEDGSNKRSLISTSTWSIVIFSLVSVTALLIAREPLSKLFGIDHQLYNWTIAFTVLWALYTLLRSQLRALQEYKFLSLLDSILPVVMLVVFFAIVLTYGGNSFIYPTIALMAGYFVYTLIGQIKTKKYTLLSQFDKNSFKVLLRYGSYGLVASLAGYLLGNADKLILNKLVSSADVGIYGAYLSSSSSIPNQAIALFLTVFAPTVAKLADRSGVYSQMRKISKTASLVVFSISLVTTALIIKLFGDQYPLDLLLVLYFSINIAIVVVTKVYSWFIAVDSLEGVKFISTQTVLAAVANLGLNILIIPIFGIAGAIWVNILCQVYILISSNYYLKKKFTLSPSTQ